MSNPNSKYCKIVKGELPSYKLSEGENFLAILDVFPYAQGITLVLTKEYSGSYAPDMNDEPYSKFYVAAKCIIKLIVEKLNVKRAALVLEGMGINHAHIKLYSLHGITSSFKEILSKDKVFFNDYQYYITTQIVPQASDKALNQIQSLLK